MFCGAQGRLKVTAIFTHRYNTVVSQMDCQLSQIKQSQVGMLCL